MTYLYGDATESPLTSNYLELLRAMLDLSVAILTGAEAVSTLGRDARDRRASSALELEQLEVVKDRLVEALDDCDAYATAPLSGRCVASIRDAALRDVERTRGEIEATLSRELARIEAAIAAQRAKNLDRLGSFLLHHDLPDANQWVDVQLISETSYGAQLVGHAAIKASWVIDLDIPSDNLFAQPIRIDKVAGQLTVKVPEEAGWVRKTVKLRTHKLAKEHVIALARSGGNTHLRLRSAVTDHDNGFDFVFSPSGRPTQGYRIVKGAPSEPFEIDADDVDSLRMLFAQLVAATKELATHRRSLKKARLDGQPIQEHTSPRLLVERLVAQIAPVVQEISRHSLSPTELVLKRVLADDQRVEIFASKAELRGKLEPLSPEHQAIFAPLELGAPVVSRALPRSPEPDHALALAGSGEASAGEPRIVFSPSIPPHKPAAAPSRDDEEDEITVAAPISSRSALAALDPDPDADPDEAPTLSPTDSSPDLDPPALPPPPPASRDGAESSRDGAHAAPPRSARPPVPRRGPPPVPRRAPLRAGHDAPGDPNDSVEIAVDELEE